MNDRVRSYIDRAPVAISGQRGHDTTLRVARTLYNGFGLCRDQVLGWLRVYNARLPEKWSDRELEHKADSAERGKYDKPRGWMLKEHQSAPRKILIRAPKIVGQCPKNAKKYVLATDAMVISHTSRVHTRARAELRSIGNIRGNRGEVRAAHRIAGELLRLHQDGAITGADDPQAPFYASFVHAFGASYKGKHRTQGFFV